MVRVKICGVRDPQVASFCVQAGADFLGLNFSPVSKRKVSIELGSTIAQVVNSANKEFFKNTKIVLLFFKNQPDEIWEITKKIPFDCIQLIHSDPFLKENFWIQMRKKYKLIPALSVEKELEDKDIPFPPNEIPILDTPAKEEGGGTGKTFPWIRLKNIQRKYMLAGGLTPSNVQDAIQFLQPWGVDVATGIEDEKGNQSLEKIQDFIHKAKSNPVIQHNQ